ncbi:hypothetical protein PtA15_2A68 [Puccinia triticina]|uniref:Secreted protein n=1 Tax=Puccinia triticina TaxID=208348 RepID=A0ABY7CBB9_9BASI|nr:uncharacterized protein PtA15_2A68 [Puccinia triticina]WAQ81757.1 hypothetical protein PtA15_2A68 [Puccinia triticina]
MVHPAIAITLMMVSVLVICCTGQPLASTQLTRRNDPTTNKVLLRRKIKPVDISRGITGEGSATTTGTKSDYTTFVSRPQAF